MSQLKKERLEATMQKELSLILRDEVKDPALRMCTVTSVTVTNDLSIAKVYISFMEHEKRGMDALERSKGFIRSKLAHVLKIRKCPELHFVVDDSLEYGNHIEELIRKIHKEEEEKQ
ncbi:30S ribosome-binding factor RbfA [Sharpea azabuensis]|uniref:30S ribosome-binding factor RbfA n=1 Tax=Sharpea azabuensis TaxID=322505 RepID=UPI001563C755|nr:30S ribosome-binding factor RbfA [Sharpea azabuensis]